MFYKKIVLNNFAIFTDNACVGVSFLIKTQAFKPETSSKRDSFTGVFLWILPTF